MEPIFRQNELLQPACIRCLFALCSHYANISLDAIFAPCDHDPCTLSRRKLCGCFGNNMPMRRDLYERG